VPKPYRTSQIAQEDAACCWAQTVRDMCLRVAVDAYEQAGLGGMCAEGRWEMAIDAMRSLDLSTVAHALSENLVRDDL
jgi:hypothetical protein